MYLDSRGMDLPWLITVSRNSFNCLLYVHRWLDFVVVEDSDHQPTASLCLFIGVEFLPHTIAIPSFSQRLDLHLTVEFGAPSNRNFWLCP